MKAEISLKQLYFNLPIANFFFRKQAWDTFEEMVHIVRGNELESRFDELQEAIEGYYGDDLDVFEEECYSMSAQEILDQLEIETW